MKLFTFPLLGAVLANDPAPKTPSKPLGTACTQETDFCGSSDNICCGIASWGTILDDQDQETDKYGPDVVICNTLPEA